uniref:Uncharacterized protein n=1 Tax=Rhizophora mucronata TaxID=61149 RepID=A0A2P2MWP1_RHIMU
MGHHSQFSSTTGMEHKRRTLQRSSPRRFANHRRLQLQPRHQMQLFFPKQHCLPHHRSECLCFGCCWSYSR